MHFVAMAIVVNGLDFVVAAVVVVVVAVAAAAAVVVVVVVVGIVAENVVVAFSKYSRTWLI